jgi:hypothetical protein
MATKTATAANKPFLDSSDGENFFVSIFVLFEGQEIKAVEYTRSPDDMPFMDILKENYVLYFRYFKTAPPELFALIGNPDNALTPDNSLNSVVIAKAMATGAAWLNGN